MKRSLKGYYALDASALIELCLDSNVGEVLRDALISENIIAYTHELAIIEVFYVLCRKAGLENAKTSVDSLLISGYLNVENISEISEAASKIKCVRSIAISDCLTLALAKEKSSNALFAKREVELIRELEKEPFDVNIEFISDW